MYKIVLINHFKSMTQAVQERHARCTLNLENFHLTLEKDGLLIDLQPQFFVETDKGLNFTPTFGPDVINFIGWLPYFNKRWTLGYDKLAFKKFATEKGHRTPPYWQIVDAPIKNVLRKASRSSIGRGISGPYKLIDPTGPEALLSEGEFYESFSFGRMCKVWYWNGKAVAAEMRPAPSIVGDGVRTVREIVAARVDPFNRDINWHAVQATLNYFGLTSAHVPTKGERVIVDYQYASCLNELTFNNDNLMLAQLPQILAEQIAGMGEDLLMQMPQEIRQNALFSVDGMVDDEQRIWWLEANCNPLVHPDAYPAMIKSVLETAERPQASDTPSADGPIPAGQSLWH